MHVEGNCRAFLHVHNFKTFVDELYCVSIYMCTRLIELTVAWQTLNRYHAKCMRFSKMQLVSHCYITVLYESISKLYIYKKSAVYLSDVFLQDTGIEKSD